MGYSLGDVIVRLKADTSDLERGLAQAESSSSNLGSKIASSMKVAAAAFAVVGAGVALVAKQSVDATESWVKGTMKLQRELGITAETASGLMAVGHRFGMDVDALSKSFGIFSKHVIEANSGNQSAIDTFSHFGLSVKDSQGNLKSFDTLFGEVADKFKNAPAGMDRNAESMKLFGKSGKDMIPILQLGSQGIAELEAQAQKYGLVLTQDNVNAVRKYIIAQKDMNEATQGAKIQIGMALMPVLSKLAQHLAEFIPKAINLTKKAFEEAKPYAAVFATVIVAVLIPAFVSLGVSIWSALAPIIPFIALAALIGVGIKLLIDHFGGLNQTIKAMRPVIDFFKKGWEDLKKAWDNLWPSIKQLATTFMSQLLPALEQLWGSVKKLYASLEPGLTQALKIVGEILAGLLYVAIWLAIHGLMQFVSMLSTVAHAIADAISWVSNFAAWIGTAAVAVAHAVMDIIHWFERLPGYVANAINSAVDFVSGLPGRITGAIGSLGSLLINAGEDLIRGLIQGIKNMAGAVVDAVKSVAKGAADVGKDVLHAAHIPGFASGVTNFGGGLALVGEMGPELVRLPKGADVITSDVTSKVMENAKPGGGNTVIKKTSIYGDIRIDSPQDADYFFKRMDKNAQLESLGGSPL